jgi:hypothetical protein
MIRNVSFSLLLLLLLAPPVSVAAETEWLVAPYIWLSDITLDQSSGVSGGISASDLLDKTDSAGMIRIEAARNRWGFTADYLWVGLSESVTIPLPPPFLGFGLNAELDVSIFELGGFFRPSGSDSGIDYLFGLRNINVDKTLIAIPPLGGPAQRFDGDSDFTDVFGIGYRFNKTFALNLGYRHLAIEFEDNVSGGVETTDIELSGPLLGFLFRF